MMSAPVSVGIDSTAYHYTPKADTGGRGGGGEVDGISRHGTERWDVKVSCEHETSQ